MSRQIYFQSINSLTLVWTVVFFCMDATRMTCLDAAVIMGIGKGSCPRAAAALSDVMYNVRLTARWLNATAAHGTANTTATQHVSQYRVQRMSVISRRTGHANRGTDTTTATVHATETPDTKHAMCLFLCSRPGRGCLIEAYRSIDCVIRLNVLAATGMYCENNAKD